MRPRPRRVPPRAKVAAVPAASTTHPWDESREPSIAWLERANRHALVTQLVATAVHDVSNALQVMSGAAEMLSLDASPEAVQRRSGSIVRQAMAATATLQQLSGFAREAARPPGPVSARDLCQRVLAMRLYATRKLRLTAGVEGDAGPCVAPARDLLQVLLNLMVNAERALTGRPDGELRFVVTADAGAVRIAAVDNGPGIAPEAQAAAFAWPPALGDDPAALGIGLRVSRALVERAGGTLEIDTAPDGGAAVVVTLPPA